MAAGPVCLPAAACRCRHLPAAGAPRTEPDTALPSSSRSPPAAQPRSQPPPSCRLAVSRTMQPALPRCASRPWPVATSPPSAVPPSTVAERAWSSAWPTRLTGGLSAARVSGCVAVLPGTRLRRGCPRMCGMHTLSPVRLKHTCALEAHHCIRTPALPFSTCADMSGLDVSSCITCSTNKCA